MKASDKAAASVVRAIANQATSLDLHGLGLTTLPPFSSALKGLLHLNISCNRITSLPDDVWLLDQLVTFDIGSNRISVLADSIGTMTRLETLDASENRLSELPGALVTCGELRELHLFGNELVDTEPISRLTKLEVLDLSGNRLRRVPPLTGLVKLRELDLSNNLIETLPDGLEALRELRILNVSRNKLASIGQIAELPQLQELHVDGDRLEIPLEVRSRSSLRIVSNSRNSVGGTSSSNEQSSARLRDDAAAAIAMYTSGGPVAHKQYFDTPPYVLEFFLAVGGITGAVRVLDLYFKRFQACCSAVIRFPTGEVVELRNLSRKAALALVHERKESLQAGEMMLDLQTAQDERELHVKSQLVLDAISQLPEAALVPKNKANAPIHFINYNFHGTIGAATFAPTKEVHVGDHISFGDVHGSNINVKSSLNNVAQVVQRATGLSAEVKQDLQTLLERLSSVLQAAPPQDRETAEAVADATSDLVAKATKEAPNRKSIEISASGLLEAAKGIAAVVPIATEIVRVVTDFAAGL